MEKPIKALFHDQLHCTRIVESEDDILAVIRAEIGDEALLLHPILYNPTRGRIKLFEEAVLKFVKELADEYNYEHWYVLTPHTRLVNLLNIVKLNKLTKLDDLTLYEGVV